jgi:hypothetical protein
MLHSPELADAPTAELSKYEIDENLEVAPVQQSDHRGDTLFELCSSFRYGAPLGTDFAIDQVPEAFLVGDLADGSAEAQRLDQPTGHSREVERASRDVVATPG